MIENELNTANESAIDRDGVKRPFYGYWAIPGGFMKSEETTSSALARELKEGGLIVPSKKYYSLPTSMYFNPLEWV